MRYKPPKFAKLSQMAAIDVGRLTEDEARSILEDIRWPDGPVCPHCGSIKVTRMRTEKARDGLIQCNGCRGQFTVTVDTVMHRSHITLRQWVQAFYSICSHKKGISALQLQRNLGLRSYKSAWHLAHRIRFAMWEGPFPEKLRGTVEVDETYVGGKPRPGARDKSGKIIRNKRGSGTRKTPVVALVERGGRARTRVIKRVNAAELKSVIRENVNGGSRVMTDENPSYSGLGKEVAEHRTVNHSAREYARGDVHVNTGESFFALLKRGIHGTFHHVSERHLHRYCDEFSFRWDHRKESDGERAEQAIRGAAGKRLVYRRRA